MKALIAEYRCLKCSHEWAVAISPQHPPCPSCGNDWYEWLNHESRKVTPEPRRSAIARSELPLSTSMARNGT